MGAIVESYAIFMLYLINILMRLLNSRPVEKEVEKVENRQFCSSAPIRSYQRVNAILSGCQMLLSIVTMFLLRYCPLKNVYYFYVDDISCD